MDGLCSPKHGPVLFTVLINLFVRMFCSHVKTFKLMAGPRSPSSPVTAQLISRQCKIGLFCRCADIQQRSNERTFVLPQTRSNAFHGFKEPFPLDGMKLFKNIRTCGWAVFPQTWPSSFHGDNKNVFVWMLCSHVKTFKLMAGPRFPTSPVTAQLTSWRWRIVSFSCCADFQQRSNERMVVLPQTRSSSIHSVDDFFYLDGMKLFKNIRTDGWVVLPQTRPMSVHVVEDSVCMDVLQPCKNIQIYGWAALPNNPCHGPAHFAALRNRFVLMLCIFSTTFNRTDGHPPPDTIPLISRCWRLFLSGWYEAFQSHSNLRLVCASPNTAQFLSRCGRTILSEC